MKVTLELPGLRLPRINEVMRWPTATRRFASGKVGRFSPKRTKEVARVRLAVYVAALEAGLGGFKPLEKAKVEIAVFGPYKTDRDGIYCKDLIDAIVARNIFPQVMSGERRWGLIVDDSPTAIGQVDIRIIRDALYRILVTVTPHPAKPRRK